MKYITGETWQESIWLILISVQWQQHRDAWYAGWRQGYLYARCGRRQFRWSYVLPVLKFIDHITIYFHGIFPTNDVCTVLAVISLEIQIVYSLYFHHKWEHCEVHCLWPLLLTWITLIPAWISNYIHYKVWDEITYPFTNIKGTTVEV